MRANHFRPLVMKFGGSSIADLERIEHVATVVDQARAQPILVVLSAMGRTTNHLITCLELAQQGLMNEALASFSQLVESNRAYAREAAPNGHPLHQTVESLLEEGETLLRGIALLREASPRSRDAFVALGERLSTHLASTVFAGRFPTEWFDARSLMRTDDRFGKAKPDCDFLMQACSHALFPRLVPGHVILTQGFIGANDQGLTTTLGRGGSDYSAALFGQAIDASEVQIWTDVEGVLTCDPRLVPEAVPLEELSFDEAAELAAFGAKVLHPATLLPARRADIPVTVRHTQFPQGRFTRITNAGGVKRGVTALACRGPITVLTLSSLRMLDQSGFLARIFDVFARHQVSVDVVSTAEVSLSLTLEPDVALAGLLRELNQFCEVQVAREKALVAIVGSQLKNTRGITQRVFTALCEFDIHMISMGANEINLSLVLDQSELPQAMRALHRALIEVDQLQLQGG
ncbi:MAG: lysine-sensitive aspartokinase 3 [Acidobacteria bacterium]|nr:lysine-sensitive aspartokinase 3 [Acidobacteriota bacterium]